MFQNEFRELANKFKENEKIIQKLAMSGSSLEAVNDELDNLETVTKALSVDVYKAKKLARTGIELILEHAFARRSLEPSCVELRNMCKKQKHMGQFPQDGNLALQARSIILKMCLGTTYKK